MRRTQALTLLILLMCTFALMLRIPLSEGDLLTLGRSIDVFTQKEPYSGRGINQSSSSFKPGSEVILYALATYNDDPVQYLPVSYEVIPPNPIPGFPLLRSSFTNESGVAVTSFVLPNMENASGTWSVSASAAIAGQIVLDTLTFLDVVRILGDLGGGTPPEFFQFDGIIDGKDLALFIECYKGNAPSEAMYLADLGGGLPPKFFAYDGKVDGLDLALFIACYKGQGPPDP